MKKILFLLLIALPVLLTGQNKEHKIKIVINGYHDSTLYLAYYYGNKIKLADTAVMSKPSTYVFKGSQELKGGIYIVVSSKKTKLFEFVLNKKQNFTLKTDIGYFNFVIIKIINTWKITKRYIQKSEPYLTAWKNWTKTAMNTTKSVKKLQH